MSSDKVLEGAELLLSPSKKTPTPTPARTPNLKQTTP